MFTICLSLLYSALAYAVTATGDKMLDFFPDPVWLLLYPSDGPDVPEAILLVIWK